MVYVTLSANALPCSVVIRNMTIVKKIHQIRDALKVAHKYLYGQMLAATNAMSNIEYSTDKNDRLTANNSNN